MEFIIDETMIKIDSTYMWIWVAIEPESKEILGISVSKERNMLIAAAFYFHHSQKDMVSIQ